MGGGGGGGVGGGGVGGVGGGGCENMMKDAIPNSKISLKENVNF